MKNSDESKMIPFIILWASLLLPIFFAHSYSCSFCSSWLKQTLSSQPTSLKGLEKGQFIRSFGVTTFFLASSLYLWFPASSESVYHSGKLHELPLSGRSPGSHFLNPGLHQWELVSVANLRRNFCGCLAWACCSQWPEPNSLRWGSWISPCLFLGETEH